MHTPEVSYITIKTALVVYSITTLGCWFNDNVLFPALTLKFIYTLSRQSGFYFLYLVNHSFLSLRHKIPIAAFVLFNFCLAITPPPFPNHFFINRICIFLSNSSLYSFSDVSFMDSSSLLCFCSKLCFTFFHIPSHASMNWPIICPI